MDIKKFTLINAYWFRKSTAEALAMDVSEMFPFQVLYLYETRNREQWHVSVEIYLPGDLRFDIYKLVAQFHCGVGVQA